MITYETAKKLKDAGFPQNWPKELGNMQESVYIPTLSELIEEIGYFQLLKKEKEIWKATAWMPENRQRKWSKGIGDTPEEAVAKLFLELNKK